MPVGGKRVDILPLLLWTGHTKGLSTTLRGLCFLTFRQTFGFRDSFILWRLIPHSDIHCTSDRTSPLAFRDTGVPRHSRDLKGVDDLTSFLDQTVNCGLLFHRASRP